MTDTAVSNAVVAETVDCLLAEAVEALDAEDSRRLWGGAYRRVSPVGLQVLALLVGSLLGNVVVDAPESHDPLHEAA